MFATSILLNMNTTPRTWLLQEDIPESSEEVEVEVHIILDVISDFLDVADVNLIPPLDIANLADQIILALLIAYHSLVLATRFGALSDILLIFQIVLESCFIYTVQINVSFLS